MEKEQWFPGLQGEERTREAWGILGVLGHTVLCDPVIMDIGWTLFTCQNTRNFKIPSETYCVQIRNHEGMRAFRME